MFMSTSSLSVAGSAPGRAASPSPDIAVEDPVPSEVHAVIDLFATQLAKVAFPEIDAGSLRRQADELRTAAKAVARARDALDAALATFAARMTALTGTATRAIAYARIYSDAHPDRQALATAIEALSHPAAPPAASLTVNGKRRGRPPRRSAELFDAGGAPAEADEASASAAGAGA
jgi:ABC-type transporter Mla subunit MlaD